MYLSVEKDEIEFGISWCTFVFSFFFLFAILFFSRRMNLFLLNLQVRMGSSFGILQRNVMQKAPEAGKLPSAAAVPGCKTFIWPRAWPQTSAEHAFGFLYILWNSERWRRVQLTRAEGDWEQDIKMNTWRRLDGWGRCLPLDPHPLPDDTQVHKYWGEKLFSNAGN